MAEYQVWHKDGETYRKVADVRAHDPLDAFQLTQNGNEAEWEHDPNEGHWWHDSPGVDAAEGAHRSTTFDDIIITPDGVEYRIADVEIDGRRDFGFQPTDAIRQQLAAERIEDEAWRSLYEWGYSGGADPKPQQPIRPLTQELIDSVRLDVWPGMATITDFGIDSSSHLGALQYAVIHETVTPEELDAAMGDGARLTEIARRGANPYRNVTFRTAWDGLEAEPESEPESPGEGEFPTPEAQQATFREWREEAEQRPLHDRSVDFADRDSHAMLGEIVGEVADRGDYQRALQNAIKQASYRTEDEERGKTL